jgi:hypothetical protein
MSGEAQDVSHVHLMADLSRRAECVTDRCLVVARRREGLWDVIEHRRNLMCGHVLHKVTT